MKASIIARIVLYSILIIVLCGVLAAGIMGGGFGLGIGSGLSYENAKLYTAGGGSVDSMDINDIEINWIDGNINIVQSKTSDITFTESENNDPMQYLVKGNKLIIQFCKPHRFMKKTAEKELTIAIPAGTELRKLEIANVNGDIIDEIFIQGDELVLDMVNGNAELDGYFREIDCDMVNGDVVLNLGDTPHEGSFDSVNGDFTLNVLHAEENSEAEGFKVELDSISGKLSSDFEVVIQGDNLVYGSGVNELDFDTVSGDVKILKQTNHRGY